ncbi:DUF952 domain-containing protein [Spirulina major CS-329]|uniref:DUF952 domain-containing protein n=1 Tax=Spirulina TaxID=1154 RepID=UPI00232EFDCB|nr:MULTISPECIES: DUF952 domain-containing protein [Spirulina]MDB9495630.1 DUF952 domain-containing protein [Spirulina subsalsa CS-330]MDB9502882.1 DUF952 domain-containing protein [Spirulina major CS-329]
MKPAPIFHITPRTAWNAAQAQGDYRPPSLATEGFIHASTLEQAIATANRFFVGQEDLVLLRIERDRLHAELKWEAVPDHGTFPHLYGPLNLDAVTAVYPLTADPHHGFTLPPDLQSPKTTPEQGA